MAGQVPNGAAYFLNGVQHCYHEYAYVYKSPSEVYNLSLGNVSNGAFVTPMLDQYIYDLPPGTIYFHVYLIIFLELTYHVSQIMSVARNNLK